MSLGKGLFIKYPQMSTLLGVGEGEQAKILLWQPLLLSVPKAFPSPCRAESSNPHTSVPQKAIRLP